ncbi:hypothetical protein [Streptomyces sp. NPDC007369]|uniref:effector-associated constant component EACC1 n=1 Tax=Streptomyces sp. NPDC007369 TaxID=3154589 RepID=UPI0033D412FA
MREYELRVDPHGAGEGPESELRSLLRWLNADETLGRAVRARIGSDASPAAPADDPLPPGTSMGGSGFDLLQLAVGTGLSTGSLVFAVLQWQVSRRKSPALTVSRDGYEVRLTGDAADDPEALRRIVEALDAAAPAVPAAPPEDGDHDGTG